VIDVGFPDSADLGVQVELDLGGTWTDITPSTRLAKKIGVTRGRADYASQVDQSKVSVQLRNPDGEFSQYNPNGPHYGLLTRNTPLRVSVAAGSAFLNHPESSSGTDRRISTPSTTALQITGDLDVRWDVEVPNWDTTATVELGGKWGAAGQQSWHAYLFSGSLWFGWTTDGTTENSVSAPLGTAVHPRRMCLRITVDVNNGSGGRTIAFFTGTSLTGPWTQIGSTTIAGTTATASSTAPVEIGDVSTTLFAHGTARIYAAQIRSGIDGTIVASPNLSTVQPGALTFTDSAGVPWTANASDAITNRTIRGTGEVPSWPARWGRSGKLVTVDVAAAGILRRLRQGTTPLDSALRRSIVASSPMAYWPLEDGSASTQAASAVLGGTPMRPAPTAPSFSAVQGPAGSLAVPDFTGGGSLSVASMPAGSTASWTIECNLLFPSGFTSGSVIPLAWRTSGSTVAWQLSATPGPDGGVAFQWQNTTGSSVHDASGGGNVTDGRWHQVRITVYQTGSNINLQLWLDGEELFEDTDVNVTCGAIQSITINPNRVANANLPSVGHVVVWSPRTSVSTWSASLGYDGETTDARMTRLAAEEGVPLLTPYGLAGDTALGPQGSDTLLGLLQDSTDADVGILYEPRDSISLAARPRVSLYNQVPALVLDYAQQQVAPPLEPQDDDQQTRNDITRSRPNGSPQRATLASGPMSTAAPPAGVGRYQDSQTVNVQSDDQALQIAGWSLNLGTYDGVRYPAVTILLHRCPELIDAARAVDIGDRLQILNLPQWLPPGGADLIVQGISESIGVRTWEITFTCTPAGPWIVGVLDDGVLGRADTAGSQLAAGVTSTATTLSVSTTSGPLWVTTAANPTEFPFDIAVGGEVMTVTGITGTTSPQSFTVTRSINGVRKAQAANADVRLAHPMILAL
jgi:hypothetical protein